LNAQHATAIRLTTLRDTAMSFTSYAADFHDLTLWLALGRLTEGSYVDTAAGPRPAKSLGRAFLERRWQGMHLGAAADLDATPGAMLLTARLGSGQSHFPLTTLDDVFDASASGPVHWLHLDAADLAAGALAGWCRSDVRPWIVVVSNATEGKASWQATLANKGYVAAGATVRTLFYVLESQIGQGVELAYLPQDAQQIGALRHALQAAEQRANAAERRAVLAEERAAQALREAAVALNEAQQTAGLQQQLHAVFASTSWQVTKPVRWLSRLRSSPGTAIPELGTVLVASWSGPPKAMLRRMIRATLAQPAVRRVVLRLALRHPKLVARLRTHLHGGATLLPIPVSTVPAPSNPASVLGPRFRMLLIDDCARFSDLQK
jgi:pyruvate/2-oxoglutarate dehydrogenase complex dihydrolipoamide acyltransferase (E2) component